YPALISVAHLLSPTETGAYVVGRVINSALFSLAAIPAYSIARRVLSRNAAIFAALLAVFVPSSIYTRTIMTENAFYPAFLVTVLACSGPPRLLLVRGSSSWWWRAQ